jgi:hypothetical protein
MSYVFDYKSNIWPVLLSNETFRACLSEREEVLKKCNYCRGLLIDFDYTKFTDETSPISEGERTVCQFITSRVVHCANGLFREQSPVWPLTYCVHLDRTLGPM